MTQFTSISPYDNLHLASWNSCGLKCYRDKDLGLYYIKNLTQLARQTNKGFIFALQETRLTQRAQKVISNKWNSFFTPQRETGLGLGFIFNIKLQNTVFMCHLNNSVATLSYTLNNYKYIYINVHLFSGSDTKKKNQTYRECK